jgi:hypothetical protein
MPDPPTRAANFFARDELNCSMSGRKAIPRTAFRSWAFCAKVNATQSGDYPRWH